MDFRRLDHIELKERGVFVRVDFTSRWMKKIRLQTIPGSSCLSRHPFVMGAGGKTIPSSHLAGPKERGTEAEPAPVAERLSRYLREE